MNNFSAKYRIVAGIILIVMIFQVAIPIYTAKAGVLSLVTAAAFSCVVAEGLELAFDELSDSFIGDSVGWLNNQLSGLWGRVRDKLPGSDDDEEEDSSSVPTATVKDAPRVERELKDCLSAGFKRALISVAISDTIAFIKSGDKPRFWENYKAEFRRMADIAARELVEEVIGVDLCTPFRAHFETIVKLSSFPKSSLFSCTLTEAIDIQERALDRFFDDFRYGGWDTWIRLHDSPNNEFGFYLAYNNKLIQRKAEEVEAAKTEIIAGDGFEASKKCKTGEPLEDCAPSDIIIATPGKILAEETSRAVGAEFENLLNAESYYEILGEILTKDISDYLNELQKISEQ